MKTPDALALCAGARSRPGRGGPRGPPARLPRARLLEVQVRAGAEAEGGAQASAADHDPRDQVPSEDRAERLRHQEGPRRAVPLGKDKVKITIMFRGREVTHPERGVALLDKLAERAGRDRRDRAVPAAGRPQHDDDARAVQGGPGHEARRMSRNRREEARASSVTTASTTNVTRTTSTTRPRAKPQWMMPEAATEDKAPEPAPRAEARSRHQRRRAQADAPSRDERQGGQARPTARRQARAPSALGSQPRAAPTSPRQPSQTASRFRPARRPAARS